LTQKIYTPGKEKIINALGFTTESYYDAYNNLIRFIEKINNRDIITGYKYDALRRQKTLIDSYNNIRTWNYDGL
jgi:hypothetical protein